LLTLAVSSRATVPAANRHASCGPIKRHFIKCNWSLEIGTTYSAANLARLLNPAYALCALGLIGSLERYAHTSFRKKQNKPKTKTCTSHSLDKTTYMSVKP